MIGVDRKIDPKIGIQEKWRGEKTLTILGLGLAVGHPFGLRLGEYRIESLGQRTIIKPNRIKETA